MSKTAYLKFKKGEKLTREEAIGAQCYECNGYSLEMKDDCLGVSCPLYGWSPWGRKHGLGYHKLISQREKDQLDGARETQRKKREIGASIAGI